jgi:hypothetical protein
VDSVKISLLVEKITKNSNTGIIAHFIKRVLFLNGTAFTNAKGFNVSILVSIAALSKSKLLYFPSSI